MEILFEHGSDLWTKLTLPLLRLLLLISVGLLIANLLESINWTKRIGAIARPLIRWGHFSDHAGTAFAMAMISGVAANSMLAEAHDNGTISKTELILANLFNSLPTYFLHLPSMIVIAVPLIKEAAIFYVGITFLAAVLRTVTIIGVGRALLLKPPDRVRPADLKSEKQDWSALIDKTWRRFKRRIRKVILFTIPIYLLVFIMNRMAFFAYLEHQVAGFLTFVPWLSPQSIGIITLQMAAELSAGLAAAGALLDDRILTQHEIILALLIGNILSSPVRAIRHQFPAYVGIFRPRLATELIVCNQLFRMLSLIIVASCYIVVFM